MKIKLDQNLSIHLREVPAALNHDVDTVFDEGLTGVDDAVFFRPQVCRTEFSLRLTMIF